MSSEDPSPPVLAPGDAEGKRPNNRRSLYLIVPLLLGLLALAGWLLLRDGLPAALSETAAAVTPSALTPSASTASGPNAAPATDAPGDGIGIVSGRATPWAVAGGPGAVTAEALATMAAPTAIPAAITLLGPPASGVFQLEDVVSFYWTAPATAGQGQRFVVYLVGGDETVALGEVVAANLGQAYRLPVAPGAVVDEPGSYSWFVVLANAANGAMIGQSENRPITILADN